MIITVRNCRDCPFVEHNIKDNDYKDNYGEEYATCLVPKEIHAGKYNVTSYYKNYKSPKWCPINMNNLTIIKRNGVY